MGMVRAAGFLACYVCLGVMVVLLALDPIMRYIVGSPFYWSNEVTTQLMVLMVFNGLALTLVKNKHIRVLLIFDRLPRKVQNVLWVIICLAGLFYGCVLGYAMIRLTVSSFTLGVRTDTAEMLIFPWQLVAAWGLLVFVIAVITLMVRRIAIALGLSTEEIEIDKSTGY